LSSAVDWEAMRLRTLVSPDSKEMLFWCQMKKPIRDGYHRFIMSSKSLEEAQAFDC
jgi:hypothetical protein